MIRCWKCAEEIQDAALVCRFCAAEQKMGASPPGQTNRKALMWAGGIVLALVVIAAIPNPSRNASEVTAGKDAPNDATAAAHPVASPAPIDPGVYEPYTAAKGWGKTVAKWGPEGIKRIQALREAAAETVAKNPACDAVLWAEIANSRSTPPKQPVVYVDCQNEQRFYLGENDVQRPAVSEKERGARFSSADLIARCTEAVKVRLSLPSTFDRKMFSVSDYQGTSGNRVIQFDFEAGNRMGATLPAKARCIMTTQGALEVTVVEG